MDASRFGKQKLGDEKKVNCSHTSGLLVKRGSLLSHDEIRWLVP